MVRSPRQRSPGRSGAPIARAVVNFAAALMAALAVLQVLPSPPSTTMASGPGAPSDDRQEEGAILVKFKPLVFSMAADFTLGFQGFRTSGATASTGVRKVAVPAGGEGEALRAMMSNPLVEYAEPVYTRTAFHVPNDARYSSQWALEKISASSAWDITTGSSGIVVAVIDTGIDIGHPDRPRNLLLGADYIADPDGGTLVSGDPQGHGTHVAGIVAANMDNGQGVSGIAPGVTIMAVRVLDAQGSGNTYITAQGIIYAADHGAKIISLSLSGLDRSIAEEEAVNYAHGKGVLVVAAAGNCYAGGANCDYQTNPINYPAALDHVVAVASTDSSDSHAWYSETGSYVDLAAPGSSILSTCINAGYCSKSGTSMSTPYASGVAALAWSAAPALDADEIDSILRRSAVDLGNGGRDDTFGYGRVDAYGAVSRARSESAPPTPTRTPSPTATATNTRTPTPTQTRSPVPIASPSPTPTASASPPPTATPPLIVAPSPSPTATPKPPVTPEPVPTATSTLTPTPTAQAPLLSWPLGPTPTPTQSPPLLSSPLGPKPTPTPLRVFLPLAIKNGAGW